ncbi:MAG: hypothetical protein KA144_08415 [Xanthomonadaceae bacterium]|nr:hypothetical protein [Xanthomonadaceae bacterium]
MLALGAAAGAHAQSKPASRDRVELPVWNRDSGQLEAVLVLEPTDIAKSSTRARFGMRHLDHTFGLGAGDSLGMFCDRKQGLSRALDNLIENCVLASVPSDPARRNAAAAMFGRNGTRIGVGAAQTRTHMPQWLAPGAGNGKVDINEITVFSQKDLPRQGYVSIAGTVAKARLQNPTEIPGFSDRWTSRQLNLGGGIGAFGVNVIGEVVDTPGPDKWEGLSLGLSWRTPWSGQLTVGADNLVTHGKNPFSPRTTEGEEEGAVPYVRYEQDL